MTRWDSFSRDETEIGAFGDERWSAADSFGGFFDSLMRKTGLKQKLEKKASAISGKPVKLSIANPTAAQLATGLGKSALMLAPIVATGGGAAALAAPALLAAAPVVKSVTAAGKAVAPTIKAADKLIADAQRGVKTAASTIASTRVAAATGAPAAAQGYALLEAVNRARLAAGVPAGKTAPVAAQKPIAAAAAPALAAALAARSVAPQLPVRPVAAVAVARPVPTSSVAAGVSTAGISADALRKAALVSGTVAPPRYVVLDTGRVLQGIEALAARIEKRAGWLVGNDGKVQRQ